MGDEAPSPRRRTRPKAADAGVLGSLPSTRPTRLARQGRAEAPKDAARPSPRPGAAAKRAPGSARRPPAAPRKTGPRAVRAGAPDLAPDQRTAPVPAGPQPPTGAALITTAVRATAELAGIGLALGVRMVRGAIGRLPRP